jgi:hypothetical protein
MKGMAAKTLQQHDAWSDVLAGLACAHFVVHGSDAAGPALGEPAKKRSRNPGGS